MLSEQLFSMGERKAAVTCKVTIHGIPSPEPFTVFNISGGTTAAQLLHQVSCPLKLRESTLTSFRTFVSLHFSRAGLL